MTLRTFAFGLFAAGLSASTYAQVGTQPDLIRSGLHLIGEERGQFSIASGLPRDLSLRNATNSTSESESFVGRTFSGPPERSAPFPGRRQALTSPDPLVRSGGLQAPATAAAAAKISVEGCVERAQRNGSVGGTGLGTTSSPNTADRDANSSETLDVFQLSSANPIPGDTASTGRTTYALDGQEQELGKHTGHRVQVTGMLAPPRAAATSTAAATAAGIRRIRVDAIKMVSASCGNAVK